MDDKTPLEIDFEKLVNAMNEFGEACAAILEQLVIPLMEETHKTLSDMFTIDITKLYRAISWQRGEDETILEWGERLQAWGFLDNPDIRWEYQKAILLWLPQKIVRLWEMLLP